MLIKLLQIQLSLGLKRREGRGGSTLNGVGNSACPSAADVGRDPKSISECEQLGRRARTRQTLFSVNRFFLFLSQIVTKYPLVEEAHFIIHIEIF